MKTVILTHPPGHNYGGILQALALSNALQELGHENIVLNGPYKKLPLLKQCGNYVKRVFRRDREARFVNLTDFVRCNLPLSARWYGRELPDCEAVVVGSDQVWRPDYTHFPGVYFLDFVPEDQPVRRIAYAASFGVNEWLFSREQSDLFGALLRRFSAVSVREDSGVELCHNHWQIPAVQMPDPTLLHTADFYRQFIPADCAGSTGGIFAYFLDKTPEKIALARDLADKSKMELHDFMPDSKKAVLPPVGDFLSGIAGADFVLTDSFHGMVFSMIFGCRYAIIGNARRGLARFELTRQAGAGAALLTEASTMQCMRLLNAPEQYGRIGDFLQAERQRGRDFLASALSGCQQSLPGQTTGQ